MTRRRLALFAVAARDDGRLRSVVAWSCLAVVASPLVTGCGARSELAIPNAPYVLDPLLVARRAHPSPLLGA